MSATPSSGKPISRCEADRLLAPLLRFPRLALAVSGGPDSLALMHLAQGLHHASGLRGRAITVLTVDHALRDGSRAEAETVGRLADGMGLPHAILTWRHGPVDARVQARAREARYSLMAAYCTAHDIPALATAHHLDDCAETFLMRLQRGSGLDGLAAIPEEGAWADLTVLRPLLEMSKARLVATVQAAGLTFAADPSNTDPRFERSRLRGAMETLEGMGFTAQAIALSAKRLRRARASLDAAADGFLKSHGMRSAAGYASVDLEALLGAPEEIALRVLHGLLGAVGGACERIRLVKLEALLAALKTDLANAQTLKAQTLKAQTLKAQTLGGCCIVPVKRRLFIFRELRKTGLPVLQLCPGERTLWDNRFRIALSAEAARPVTVQALGDAGVGVLKEREGLPASVPRLAARALPACWRDGKLLGLPDFDQDLHTASWSRHEGRIDCRAAFLWGAFGF